MYSFDLENKILCGKKVSPIFGNNITLGSALLHTMRSSWNWILQTTDDDQINISNREMIILSIRAAQNLTKQKIGVGDVVGIVARNSTFLTPIILGSLFIGAPLSPLDPIFSKDDIQFYFNQTNPKIIFCDADLIEKIGDALEELSSTAVLVTLDEKRDDLPFVLDFFEMVAPEVLYNPPCFEDAADLCAAILFTSGTTGLPKGVQVTHGQCMELQYMHYEQINSIICFDSLHWLSGFSCLIYSLFRGVRRIITKRPFNHTLLFSLIEKYDIEFVMINASQATTIFQSPGLKLANLTSVKVLSINGGVVYEKFRKGLEDYFFNAIILISYGLNEVGMTAAITNGSDRKPMSVGKPFQNVEIKFVDDNGNALNVYKIGEIVIRPLNGFIGYIGNEDATHDVMDEDSWIRTGDLGYYDEELNIFIVDRKKDIISYFGRPIAPTEIESFIMNIPGVKNVSIVGIPDILANDLPTAVVIKNSNSDLHEDDILLECANNFPEFKQLHGGVFFAKRLAMTANGKVKRKLVKEMAIKLYLDRHID